MTQRLRTPGYTARNSPAWRSPAVSGLDIPRGMACCLCNAELGDTSIAGLRIGPACVERVRAIAADAGVVYIATGGAA